MKYNVAVVGAGIIGLLSALKMRALGYKVLLLDKRSNYEKAKVQRLYALNLSSLALLDELDVSKRLPQNSLSNYSRMHIFTDTQDSAALDFDSRHIGKTKLGAFCLEGVLTSTLLDCCASNNSNPITYLNATSVVKLIENEDFVEIISQNASFSAKIVMLTDGSQSSLREDLQIKLNLRPYNQHAVVASVETAKPHLNACYQIFSTNGVLGFLPYVRQNQCAIVWSTTVAHAQELMSLQDEEFNETLSNTFKHRLGKASVMGERITFPLIRRHVENYVSNRSLLLGDAAHSIHPMAGLGLNVGIADLRCWVKYHNQFGMQKLTRALKAYQRERKYEVTKIILLLDGLNSLCINPLKPLRLIRDIGLQAFNTMPLVKEWLIKEASM
ncbi:MAG: hypothetical protein A3F18_03685 [Legionellales bacterium RIFCSPHIGHO2_12_FULL_37_14]|nr:MAG: hypothetical protein A3F18_03685 [Legionellales bacterium RIFCSPHIGHO2_12_FULL_37_14]